MKTATKRALNSRVLGRRVGRAAPARKVKSAARKVGSILVPVDFSAESRRALTYAVTFARQSGARLTLLYVIEPVAMPDFAKGFPLMMENDELTRKCRAELQEMVRKSGIEDELVEKILVRYGRSYSEITDAARTLKSDLIIISTHGYTGLKHAFLGSTTERVVRHAKCPVLVVRPDNMNLW